MEPIDFNNVSHRRYNILTGEWVLVSPHRTKRPWQGQEEIIAHEQRPIYDDSCYLCPGNTRAGGAVNPEYTDTFVFDNDYAAIQRDLDFESREEGLLRSETEVGICRVVCFSPDHSKSLADLPKSSIEKVIEVWQQQFTELAREDFVNYIQIFENKGSVMGCSNPHPHGQIWAHHSIPNEVQKKDKFQERYFQANGKSLLRSYLQQEMALNERVLYENSAFLVLVPFWAVWPYEVMILPKEHQYDITALTTEDRKLFAEALSKITRAYDRLFNASFPYSSGIHQAPTNRNAKEHWHWHMSFYPPLLRSATVKKFMVGYEMFATPQRDHTPEYAAMVLKKLF